MDVSREEAEPDTSVDINFESKPNSYIGVTGIDQSVLLLKSGNDISQVSIDWLKFYQIEYFFYLHFLYIYIWNQVVESLFQ